MASNSTEPDVLDFKQDLGQFEPEPFNLEPWLSVYTDAQDPIDSFSALSSESSFESSPKTHKPANSSSYLKPLEPGLDTDPWGLIEEVREELLALKAFLRKNTPTP
jgi:hypothetical protein